MNINRMFQSITSSQLNAFFRQLMLLLRAGIPLSEAFIILSKSEQDKKMYLLIMSIWNDLESGQSLAKSLKKHPRLFPTMICELIDVGERSSALCTVIEALVHYQEKMVRVKKTVQQALTYPIILISVSIAIAITLLTTVVPQFDTLFQHLHGSLPFATQCMLHCANTLKHHALSGLLLIILSIFYIAYIYQNNKRGAQRILIFLHRTPWIGNILHQTATLRFTRTLAIALHAGLPLIRAVEGVLSITGNRLYAQAILTIHATLSQGISLHTAMRNTGVFSEIVIQMVAVGEESASLSQMLHHIADTVDDALHTSIAFITRLIEPIIITTMGTIIGVFIITLYLPLFKLGAVL